MGWVVILCFVFWEMIVHIGVRRCLGWQCCLVAYILRYILLTLFNLLDYVTWLICCLLMCWIFVCSLFCISWLLVVSLWDSLCLGSVGLTLLWVALGFGGYSCVFSFGCSFCFIVVVCCFVGGCVFELIFVGFGFGFVVVNVCLWFCWGLIVGCIA